MTATSNAHSERAALTRSTRIWADAMAMWRLCAKPGCRRAHGCRGDVDICFPRHLVLLPQGVRDWFAAVGAAQEDGVSFDQAMAGIDGSDAGVAFREWREAVAFSLGKPERMPPRWWNPRGPK